MPSITVQGRKIIAEAPRDPESVLSGIESAMVDVLRLHGPVLERGVFEEHCQSAGVNRFSFNAALMTSPVICQFGRSIYGLVGSRISRGRLRVLSAKCQGRPTSRVLREFGRLHDGRLYLVYRLSKASITGGVTTVPAALKDSLEGRFTIRTAEGETAGSLVAREGCAWGLGPALRREKVRPGDHMVLLFNPASRTVEAHLGDEDLLRMLVESLDLQIEDSASEESMEVVAQV